MFILLYTKNDMMQRPLLQDNVTTWLLQDFLLNHWVNHQKRATVRIGKSLFRNVKIQRIVHKIQSGLELCVQHRKLIFLMPQNAIEVYIS